MSKRPKLVGPMAKQKKLDKESLINSCKAGPTLKNPGAMQGTDEERDKGMITKDLKRNHLRANHSSTNL